MDELSLNILDIAYNSIRAHASFIQIVIRDSESDNVIDIDIQDNGDGMEENQVIQAMDPFYTTRKTRKVGLGISLLKENAELTGGYLQLDSKRNIGTLLQVRFVKNHIDTPMMGNLVETMVTLIQADEKIDYELKYITDYDCFEMNTKEMKEILGDVKITEPEIIVWLKDYIKEGLKQ